MHTDPAVPLPPNAASAVTAGARTHWFMGLPVDCLTLDETRARIFEAVRHRRRLLFCTPNVSFFALAQRKPDFHQILLQTDLSLMDSMPLTWLARGAGVPVPERVAGSTLMESLLEDPTTPPIRIFFFGGSPGVARSACNAVNATPGAVTAVGALDPGFVSLEQMSTPDIIDEINASNADLLVVALGAEKGHRWIHMNRQRLTVPVISHLGAVVNFLAGTVRRAPAWMQRSALEWLWRIREEPALARRYLGDSGFLIRAAASTLGRQAIPQFGPPFGPRSAERRRAPLQVRTSLMDASKTRAVTLHGALTESALPELDETLAQTRAATGDNDDLILDLDGLTHVDARSLGHLYALAFRTPAGASPGQGPKVRLICRNSALLRRFNATALVSTA